MPPNKKETKKISVMKTIQKFVIATLAPCCLMTISCGKQSTTVERKPIDVKTETVKKTEVSAGMSFSGTIEEENGSELSFPVAGTVKIVAISAGQKVQKGQLIAILEDATFRNSLEMATASLTQAEDAYNRMKILHDNNTLPDVQWVDAQSKLQQAQSACNIAKKNLSDTRLYAPFSGYISEKNIEIGTNVMPSMPVAKLVTVDKVKVSISVPETEISNIKVGDSVEITVPAVNNSVFAGVVREKGVSANPLSRSYEVKAEIANPQHALLPGMLCTLNISGVGSTESAILLQRNAVELGSDNRSFVWAVEKDHAVRRYVELREFAGDKVVIESGLADGEKVIIEGQQKISDNMKVNVIK